MAAIALGGRKLRRRRRVRKPDEPPALPVEWLAEREDNQTQDRQDCGVPGTTGGRRSSAEVEQNTSPQNIYLASLFIRKCIKQPKHSTPCLDVTPRRSAPYPGDPVGKGEGGDWSLDPVSTLLKWMLRLCHFVCQLLLKCLISRFTLVLKLLDILTPLWSVFVAFFFLSIIKQHILSPAVFRLERCSQWDGFCCCTCNCTRTLIPGILDGLRLPSERKRKRLSPSRVL